MVVVISFGVSTRNSPQAQTVILSRAMWKLDIVPDTAARMISYRLAISTLPPSRNDLINEAMPTVGCVRN